MLRYVVIVIPTMCEYKSGFLFRTRYRIEGIRQYSFITAASPLVQKVFSSQDIRF